MSNADLLRSGYDAWNRADRDAWLEVLHPDIVISTSGAFPDFAPQYRGHEGAGKFWDQMLEPWEEFHIDVVRIEEEADIAAGDIRFRARGRGGVDVDMRFGSGIRLRDGVAIELVNRRTFEDVLKALRESDRAAQEELADQPSTGARP
jgi:ketosteroid isomerase-like protein